ncbi:MAG TPA: hypothetical protein VMU16_04465 [Candidatus Binataceae bacterium]|nr:hypothetical protein [Candidatus Binataceae bacterium]
MKIEYLVLADAAQVGNGKLFILGGGWSIFRSGNYPAPAQLAVGLGFLISWNETGTQFPLSITLADEAGVPIIPEITGQIQASKSGQLPEGITQKVPLAVNLSVSIPHPGRYTITATAGASRIETFFDAIYVGKSGEPIPHPAGERGN